MAILTPMEGDDPSLCIPMSVLQYGVKPLQRNKLIFPDQNLIKYIYSVQTKDMSRRIKCMITTGITIILAMFNMTNRREFYTSLI